MTLPVANSIDELTCFTCLYDLRGRGGHEVCPECGASVAASMRADRWDHVNRAWARRVRRGLLWAASEFAVLLVGMFNTVLPPEWNAYVVGGVFAGMAACAVVSAWAITAPEPGVGLVRRAGAIRWLTVGVAVGYAAVFATAVFRFTSYYWWVPYAAMAGWVMVAVLNGLKQWLQLGYLREFVKRVPGARVGVASRVMWWVPLVGWWTMAAGQWIVNVLGDPWRGVILLVAMGMLMATAVYDVVVWRVLRVR